jgi:hypothetical protein
MKSIWKKAAAILNCGKEPCSIEERERQKLLDRIIMGTSVIPVIAGHLMQYDFFFPRFLRWHLTDMFDVPMTAAFIDTNLIRMTGRSHPVLSSSLAYMGGFVVVVAKSQLPNRSFDYVDLACFTCGAVAYLGAKKALERHVQRRNTRRAQISAPENNAG